MHRRIALNITMSMLLLFLPFGDLNMASNGDPHTFLFFHWNVMSVSCLSGHGKFSPRLAWGSCSSHAPAPGLRLGLPSERGRRGWLGCQEGSHRGPVPSLHLGPEGIPHMQHAYRIYCTKYQAMFFAMYWYFGWYSDGILLS